MIDFFFFFYNFDFIVSITELSLFFFFFSAWQQSQLPRVPRMQAEWMLKFLIETGQSKESSFPPRPTSFLVDVPLAPLPEESAVKTKALASHGISSEYDNIISEEMLIDYYFPPMLLELPSQCPMFTVILFERKRGRFYLNAT